MKSTQILIASLGSLVLLAGCGVDAGPAVGPAYGPPPDVAYAPGYYYDDADVVVVDGVRRPRSYWYSDGHHWERRNDVPRGVEVHDRAAYARQYGGGHGDVRDRDSHVGEAYHEGGNGHGYDGGRR